MAHQVPCVCHHPPCSEWSGLGNERNNKQLLINFLSFLQSLIPPPFLFLSPTLSLPPSLLLEPPLSIFLLPFSLPSLSCYIWYSRKVWWGIKSGSLVVYPATTKLKSTNISYLHIIIRMAIPYQIAKFKSANIFPMAILGPTAKFNSRQCFRLYGTYLSHPLPHCIWLYGVQPECPLEGGWNLCQASQ